MPMPILPRLASNEANLLRGSCRDREPKSIHSMSMPALSSQNDAMDAWHTEVFAIRRRLAAGAGRVASCPGSTSSPLRLYAGPGTPTPWQWAVALPNAAMQAPICSAPARLVRSNGIWRGDVSAPLHFTVTFTRSRITGKREARFSISTCRTVWSAALILILARPASISQCALPFQSLPMAACLASSSPTNM
jgi:hypothetical protein